MADKKKELYDVTRELAAELMQMTIAEIEGMREAWLEKLKEDHILKGTVSYINSIINSVIELK